jgi:hypothetical protein
LFPLFIANLIDPFFSIYRLREQNDGDSWRESGPGESLLLFAFTIPDRPYFYPS